MRTGNGKRLVVFLVILCAVIAYVAWSDGEHGQIARSFLRSLMRTLF